MAKIQVDIDLKDGGKLNVNKSAINSISSLSQSNADPNTIFYGILSNTGTIEISDKNSNIKKLIENNLIDNSGVGVNVFANGNQVQSHISGDSSYKDNILNMDLTDKLTNISSVIYSNPEKSNCLSDINGLSLLIEICQKCSPELQIPVSGSNNLPYNEATALDVRDYLKFIRFKDIDLEFNNANPQEILNNFCNATQLNLIYGNNADNTLIFSRPVAANETNNNLLHGSIMVDRYNIFKNGQTSVFLKNKIKQVNIPVFDLKYSARTYYWGNMTSDTFEEKVGFYKRQIDSVESEGDRRVEIYGNWYIFQDTISQDEYIKLLNMAYVTIISSTTIEFMGGLEMYNSLDDFKNDLPIKTSASSMLTHFVVGIVGGDLYNNYVNKYTVTYAIYNDSYIQEKFPFKFYLGTVEPQPGNVLYMDVMSKEKKIYSIASEENVKNQNIFEFPENSFLTSTSTIDVYGEEIPLYEYIAQNILNDYKNGIKTKNIQIRCGNLHYTKARSLIAKNWDMGEILNLGDVINLESDKYSNENYIDWKITGREFTFKGVPLLNLELQECKRQTKLYDI